MYNSFNFTMDFTGCIIITTNEFQNISSSSPHPLYSLAVNPYPSLLFLVSPRQLVTNFLCPKTCLFWTFHMNESNTMFCTRVLLFELLHLGPRSILRYFVYMVWGGGPNSNSIFCSCSNTIWTMCWKKKKKTILSLLNWHLCEKSIDDKCKQYFWTLSFVSLVCRSILKPEPYCPNYCSFVISILNQEVWVLHISRVFWLFGSLAYSYEF